MQMRGPHWHLVTGSTWRCPGCPGATRLPSRSCRRRRGRACPPTSVTQADSEREWEAGFKFGRAASEPETHSH
eukprot:2624341-Rhodomonas_salina.1